MSATAVTKAYPSAATQSARWEPSPIWRFVDRYTPSQGWDTFLLLFLAVGTVAVTVRQGDWVDTPGMFSVVFWSCIVGLALAKVRAPWPLLFPAGIAIGVVFVAWEGSRIVEGGSLSSSFTELWDRLGVWRDAATTDQISTDLLPLSLTLLGTTWLLGYVSSWFLFRSTNMWIGLVLTGTPLLTVLSFLPDIVRAEFLVFMLLAMLLVARITTLKRREQWQRDSIEYSPGARWLATRVVVGLIVPVLLIAALVPFQVMVSSTAVDAWNVGRAPITTFENEFGRLFSGVPSRKDLTGRFFGTSLPFQGKISFEGEVVFWASAEDPAYWLSRTYSEYTSRGWKAGDTTKQRTGPDSQPPPPQESSKRDLVTHQLDFTFGTNKLLAGGNLAWVSREAVAETLLPMQFEIDARDPSRDGRLPEDVQRLAQEIRQELASPQRSFAQSSVARLLPEDMALVSVSPSDATDGSSVRRIKLARKEPAIPDVVTWTFADRIKADESYAMRAFVSDATRQDLREAGTAYSGFLKDHYLQLPDSLPQRVRDLAAGLAEDAETPLDKALVIQSFLRGPNFTYSQDIEKPPSGADGVDHFLFESRVGYSDYFASAMAVMLRSVGVPSRMAAGYAPGELIDGTGRRQVKDSDSHGWVQVYFPSHGWIEFEPTTRWAAPDLRGSDEADTGSSESPSDAPIQDCDEPGLDEFKLFLDECPDAEGNSTLDPSLFDGSLSDGGFDPSTLVAPFAAIASVLAAATLVVWALWARGLRNATLPEITYTKMSRLGTLAGIGRRRDQTPGEYARTLGSAVPAVAADAQLLATAYAANRYGNRPLTDEGSEELSGLWKRVRGGLLAGIARRLLPV